MKETMDGAAKSIDIVAKCILPQRPHHLSLSSAYKYPKPDGFWFTGESSPLQYLTFVSDADRGILYTRASYEICEEPEGAPAAMPVKVLAKGEVKKKLSIKDYQRKKNNSASPTDNEPAVKSEARPNGAPAPAKVPREEDRKEAIKPIEKHEMRQEGQRPEKPRSELNGERTKSSQQKPHADAESRKRNADIDGTLPPQKRVKSDSITSRPDTSRPTKPEPPRARDRVNEKSHRNSRGESLHPTANGLAPSTADRERENTASPRSTIQVNGTRPHSDSGRSTPRRMENTARSALPELLSPLHPALEAELQERETGRKRIADKAPPRPQKTDPPAKKPKQPLPIPQLLSPTLPPIVEAELARRKKLSSKEGNNRNNLTPESPTSTRKTKVQHADEEEPPQPARPSRIVTIKLKKAMAKRAKELLSLPSRSAKEALRKERSMSVEDTPPPARKRPRPVDDTPSEPTVAKRNKATADSVIARPIGPSTPLKQSATAMSRVTSNQSMGTPGNSQSLTLTPGALDRPPTRSGSVEPGRARSAADMLRDRAAIENLKEKNEEYRLLGNSLKHQRDDIMSAAKDGLTKDDERRRTALHFEMILAYMVSFSMFNQSRILERKVCDLNRFESLLPHFSELRYRIRREGHPEALLALALQLHAICLEHITAAFQTLDPQAALSGFARWAKLERQRAPTWADAIASYDAVEDRRMRTLMGPWTKVEDAVMATLNILRRWADRHNVRWNPVVMKDKQADADRERDRDQDRERERPRERIPERMNGGGGGRDRHRERDRDRD